MSLRRGVRIAPMGLRLLARMVRHRRRVQSHLAGRSRLPPPGFVQLRLTDLCNLRCCMCGQWGESGIFRTEGEAGDGANGAGRIRQVTGPGSQLTTADWIRVIDQAASWKPLMSLYGGEPFLYPGVMELVRAIKSRGLVLTVITNGWQLPELAEDLVEVGLDCLTVSVDGPPDLHDRIRGKAGSWQRLADGLSLVARSRGRRGAALPLTVAMLPVTEHNFERIPEAVEAVRGLGVDVVNLGLRWYVPSAEGERHEREMREEFGIEARSWVGFRLDGWPDASPQTTEKLESLVGELRRMRRGRLWDELQGRSWISFIPDLSPEQVPIYLTDHGETLGHDLCPVPWSFLQVGADGTVVFCGDFPDYEIGDVQQSTLDEIWRGERAEAFRERILRAPLAVCSRCCGSYVHGRWSRPEPGE